MPHIGTLRESHLHAALKQYYAQPGDIFESPVAGFVADIVRGDLVIEIQTANFSPLKRKLPQLLQTHRLRLVHPIAVEKWIVRTDAAGRVLSRRKSPRRGCLEHIFLELVSLPELAAHPNFSLEVALVREEERRAPATRNRRRRKEWRTVDRVLLEVLDFEVFEAPADYAHRFLPEALPQPFTSRELARALGRPHYLGQKATYCLHRMGLLEEAGRRGRAKLWRRAS
ncbi:MAG: hypothetical protein RMK99_00365 [Anaerolineales bacterium]|nr:hypothetical protein [Anaerolineales bacterium]